MRLLLFSILSFAVLALSSCEKEGFDNAADEELILAIQNANDKQMVDISTLPTVANAVLTSEYTESLTEQVFLAADLGYEVQMLRLEGTRVGERTNIYFSLDGRPLAREGHRGKRGKHNRGDCGGRDLRECFELVFPVSFTMPDGSTISGEDKETVFSQIKDWYEANPDTEERPSLQFPVDIVFEDATTQTINSEEELETAFEENCERKGKRKKKCFELVFPITVVMPDGSTISGEDRAMLHTDIKAWYEANPASEEKPTLQFPVDIVFEDETTQTINNEDELDAAKAACEEE